MTKCGHGYVPCIIAKPLLLPQVDKVKRSLGVEFAEYKKEAVATIEDLRTRLSQAESELNILDSYRANKSSHDKELEQLKQSLNDQCNYTKNALEEQERWDYIFLRTYRR